MLFLVEEYEPRCYWFAVFECLRRIVMTGGLTIFDPVGPIRVAVGLMISMISYRVYTYYRPFISDDNDTIAEIVQTQLVMIFFAALMFFARAEEDTETGLATEIFSVTLIILFFVGFVAALFFVFAEAVGKQKLTAISRKVVKRIYNCLNIKIAVSRVFDTTEFDHDATENPAVDGKTIVIINNHDEDDEDFHTEENSEYETRLDADRPSVSLSPSVFGGTPPNSAWVCYWRK